MTTAVLGSLRLVPTRMGPELTLSEAIALGREDREGPGRYVQDALAVDFSRDTDDAVEVPAPEPWAARLAQAVIEVMAGTRPAGQLLAWTTPTVHAVIARQGALALRRAVAGGSARGRQRLAVRRVLVCRPTPRVAEATVVLTDGDRTRALALRLVCPDGRWRIEALQIG